MIFPFFARDAIPVLPKRSSGLMKFLLSHCGYAEPPNFQICYKFEAYSYNNTLVLRYISFPTIVTVKCTIAEVCGRYVVVVPKAFSEFCIIVCGCLSFSYNSIMLLASSRLFIFVRGSPALYLCYIERAYLQREHFMKQLCDEYLLVKD